MFVPAALWGRDSRVLQGHLSACSACSAEEGGTWGLCSPGLSPPHRGAALWTASGHWARNAFLLGVWCPPAQPYTSRAHRGLLARGVSRLRPPLPEPLAGHPEAAQKTARKGLDVCLAPPAPRPRASPQPGSAQRPSLLIQALAGAAGAPRPKGPAERQSLPSCSFLEGCPPTPPCSKVFLFSFSFFRALF